MTERQKFGRGTVLHTQHTMTCEREAYVHSSSSGRLGLRMENQFSQQEKCPKMQKEKLFR